MLSRSFSYRTDEPSKVDGPAFDKILIANRGEIACRVIKTCKQMGIQTVAVYSEADARSLHVQLADEAVCVGPAPSADSYLRMDRILEACKQTGAQAVHPGYGFLSENKDFCDLLEEAGIVFIGPKVPAITAMGDKIASKQLARDANVDTVPGVLAIIETDEDVTKIANEIGYPVMIKASAGGGGKGMRIAWDDQDAIEGFKLSTQEAINSFGDDRIFIEKFIEDPRHIELQVLVDAWGNGVYLNERECTIQRRNQKVIEEAPSQFLDEATRKAMGAQALALAYSCDYESAGTVEFLVDKHKKFYFLEMNTRLQVEHPVTELITGVDLVEQMINIAAGRKLPMKQEDVKLEGWAFESRVYAENPLQGFLPSIGFLERYIEPVGTNVRCDSGIREGSEISIHYDPLICKLVTYGENRDVALEEMRQALDKYVIRGVTNNINFLRSLTDHPRFIDADMTTNFIPEEYPDGYLGHTLNETQTEALVTAAVLVHYERLQGQLSISGQNARFDTAEILDVATGALIVKVKDQTYVARLFVDIDEELDTEDITLTYARVDGENVTDEKEISVDCDYSNGDILFNAYIDNTSFAFQTVEVSDRSSDYTLSFMGSPYQVSVESPLQAGLSEYMPLKAEIDTEKMILSPMPGVVHSVAVKVGDIVVPGQEICVVEAMKMQNALRAVGGGVVKSVNYQAGDIVAAEDILIELEPAEEAE
jgi:propionyl-CoA carboxylase alpha chain